MYIIHYHNNHNHYDIDNTTTSTTTTTTTIIIIIIIIVIIIIMMMMMIIIIIIIIVIIILASARDGAAGARIAGEASRRVAPAVALGRGATPMFRGSRLSDTTCLTHLVSLSIMNIATNSISQVKQVMP